LTEDEAKEKAHHILEEDKDKKDDEDDEDEDGKKKNVKKDLICKPFILSLKSNFD
jgi:hypothetical protein